MVPPHCTSCRITCVLLLFTSCGVPDAGVEDTGPLATATAWATAAGTMVRDTLAAVATANIPAAQHKLRSCRNLLIRTSPPFRDAAPECASPTSPGAAEVRDSLLLDAMCLPADDIFRVFWPLLPGRRPPGGGPADVRRGSPG